MKLHEKLPDTVSFGGKTYRIRPSFDRVLEAYEVLNSNWNVMEKVRYCVWLLYKDKPKNQVQALSEFFKQIVGESKGDETKKIFDFVKDSEYIYSAFLQSYGINLFDVQDRKRWQFWKRSMHWCEFVALFSGLPRNTRMAEIMEVRASDIPERTKYNGAQVNSLIKRKQAFSLEQTDVKEQMLGLFNKLAGMAKK